MPVSRNWSNLRDFLRKTHNREVHAWFRDDEDEEPNNSTSRKNAKRACLILPKESQQTALIKILNFRWLCQRAWDKPEIFGTPVTDFNESFIYKPQVTIHWREKSDSAKSHDRQPVLARYTVRYRGELESKTNIETLAHKIHTIFGGSSPHHFTKGRNRYSYFDKPNGYRLIVAASSKTGGKDVINRLLQIQDDNPLNDDFLTESIPESVDTTPGTFRIDGETYKYPKRRPVVEVYYNFAEIKHYGLTRPIVLDSDGAFSLSRRFS